MKKLINDPQDVVDEAVDGLVAAHPEHFKRVEGVRRALIRRDAPIEGKVAIVTGGGSGHLPLFLGYVGWGLADGVAIGNVFSAPSFETIAGVSRAVASGAGVLHLLGNYAGDVMSFELAAEALADEGIAVATSIVADDVASAVYEERHRRRGIAGLFFAYKLAGAKAEERAPLEEVKRIADKANERLRSIGVALTPCIIPEAGRPTFSIAEDEMEIGMGIHGERGVERTRVKAADDVVLNMLERLLKDRPLRKSSELAILVNGLGATPPEELYIVYRAVHRMLGTEGMRVHTAFVGEYATSMDMSGASITILELDEELKALLAAPYRSPLLLQSQAGGDVGGR